MRHICVFPILKGAMLASALIVAGCAGIQPGTGNVVHLSDEWARAVLFEMKKDQEFMRAVQGINFTLQHEVTDVPGGRGEVMLFYTHYSFNGPRTIGTGPVIDPDVVFSGTYEAWKKVHTGNITLGEALQQDLITFEGEYQIVVIFLERLKAYGKPLAALFQRVPTRWLDAT